MIRIAAVGDVHVGADTDGSLRRGFEGLADEADVLLLCGDLTKCGTPEEAALFVEEVRDVSVPMLAVLGNHDHHAGQSEAVVDILATAGIRVLEGHATVIDLPGGRLGVAGVKGFCGGFAGANATAFGEPEMKSFVGHTQVISQRLRDALSGLSAQGCDARVALLHYSPVPETLTGERLEIYPFLGSQMLAEAIDEAGADLALHGHAHAGTEKGTTPGGVPVRNVAMPVIRCGYRVFELDPRGGGLDGRAHAGGRAAP